MFSNNLGYPLMGAMIGFLLLGGALVAASQTELAEEFRQRRDRWRFDQECSDAQLSLEDYGVPMHLNRTDIIDVYTATRVDDPDTVLWFYLESAWLLDGQSNRIQVHLDGDQVTVKQNLAIWETNAEQSNVHCTMIRPWESSGRILGTDFRSVTPTLAPYKGYGILVHENHGERTLRTEAGNYSVRDFDTAFLPGDPEYRATWAVVEYQDGFNILLNLTSGEDDRYRYTDVRKAESDWRTDEEGYFVWVVKRPDGKTCIRRWRDEVFCTENIYDARVWYQDDLDPDADRYLTFTAVDEKGRETPLWYSHKEGYLTAGPYQGSP